MGWDTTHLSMSEPGRAHYALPENPYRSGVDQQRLQLCAYQKLLEICPDWRCPTFTGSLRKCLDIVKWAAAFTGNILTLIITGSLKENK